MAAPGGRQQAELCRQGQAPFEIEGHARQQIGSKVACGIEVAHPREAVAALEGAEDSLHRAAQRYERVIALNLLRREWLVPLAAAHHPVAKPMSSKMFPQALAVIAAIGIDRAGIGGKQGSGDADVLDLG